MNKPKSVSRFILAAVLFAVSAASAVARPWPHEGSDLPADPAVQWGRLDNGIRYVILPWPEPPGRVSLRLLVEAGSVHESERQKGLAHVIEHMAFNGTRTFSAGEMVEYFQRLGMGFGPDTNAHTWWRETVYYLELPRNEEALMRDGLRLLRDYADGILMEEQEVEKEKGVVLSEYRDRNSPQFKDYLDALQFSLPDSLLSRRVTIGDEDVIRMATRQDLLDYYRKWYTPDRMVMVAVGDFDKQAFMELFTEYFGGMEAVGEPQPDPDLGTIVPAETRIRFFSNPELPIAEIEVYARRRIGPQADTAADRMERVRLDLANAMLARRFERISQQEEAPLTEGTGYDYRWMDFVRFTGVSVKCEPQDWERAMEVAVTELNRAIQFGFTQAELDEARAKLLNRYREAAARAATRKNRDLSEEIVRSVRDGFVFMDPAAEEALFVPQVEAVKLDDVQSAFRPAWDTPERLVNVSGNFTPLVKDSYDKAMQVAVEPSGAGDRKPWAYTRFGEASAVVDDNYIEDLGIRQIRLANGVRLNLKRTDYEANKVHVRASFGAGKLELPADRPGLALLAGSILVPGGLGQHSEDDIKALTAGRTVGVEFSVDDNQFTLGGITNKDDLPLQLQLMAAYLSDPGYRPEARRLFMRELDALYTQLAHNPEAILQNEVARFIAGGDPRFGFPLRAELEARTTEEVADWLREPLASGYLELSVVGDFGDEEAVIAAVRETVGALPPRAQARPDYAEARKVAFPRGAEARVFPYDSAIPRAITTIFWPTADQSDIERARRLSVLASVYSDRMRIEIREAIGEAYSPFAVNTSSDTFEDYGYFRALVGVDPSKADLVNSILLKIGSDLAAGGITEDERVRAIEPIKSQITEFRRTNRYWMNSVLLRSQAEPQRLDWARSFVGFWDTVTVAELNELAGRYLQPGDAVPVLVQPRS